MGYLMLIQILLYLGLLTNLVGTVPTSQNVPATANINENDPIGTSVFTVTATGTGPFTYSFNPISTEFQIDATSGVVTNLQTFNYEVDATTYSVTVRIYDASDASDTDFASTISLIDLNDESPVVTGNAPIVLDEEVALGTVLTLPYTVDDADAVDTAATLTYTLTGADSTFFLIDSGTPGQITVARRLDYETKPSYSFDLVITDANSNSVTETLTVTLNDINDNKPVCSPAVYYTSTPEQSASGLALQVLSCTDNDVTAANNVLTYAIVSGDDATPKFAISTSTIQTTATPIDYETLGGQSYQYTLKVDVVDSGATQLTVTATIIVQISPVNEDAPAFAVTATPFTISESVNIGSTVTTLVATDSDSGSDGTVSYHIVSTTDNGGSTVSDIFRIDQTSGVLTTLTSLDRDTSVQFYTVVIRASDGNVIPKTADITVTVNIGDYNDNPPIFTQSSYTINTVTESTTASTSLYLFSASDADQSSTLSYSIEVGDTSKFEFDTGTPGQLNLKSIIDLDSPTNDQNYYTLRIIATDGGSPALTGTASVTISVTAVNQHDPVFGTTLPSASETVSEAVALGTLIATVSANDNDYGVDGDVTYTITGGDAGSYFTIDPVLGKITSNKALDFESQPNSPLQITATDGGSPARVAITTVTVTLTDVNDNIPTCTVYSVLVNILENSAVTSAVTTLTCSDSDTSDTLSYTITNGDPSSNFAISATGAITLAKVVDYDSATQSYILEVTITDGTNTIQVSVVVNVTPVNEDTPSLTDVTIPIAENTNPSVITTFGATDLDYSPHNIVQYSITAVTQSGTSLFNIDSTDGEIQLIGNLDYESLPAGNKNYEITVEAVDGGSLTGTGTLTITVTDVNDNLPSCIQSIWTTSIDENLAAASNVQALGCSDPDGTSLTYNIVSGDDATLKFAISTSTIQTTATPIDYETLGGQSYQYTLKVDVVDGGSPALTTTTVVIVQINPINEDTPDFGAATSSQTILENVNVGHVVDTFTAADTDSGADGTITYQIMSTDDNSAVSSPNIFHIDSISGQLTTLTSLDRDAGVQFYTVVIRASDGNVIPKTADITVTVNIGDYNDNPPIFSQSSYTINTVTESTTASTSLYLFSASDADQSSTLSYFIEVGDTSKFEFDTGTPGQLNLKSIIDLDSPTNDQNYYTLRIIATDGGSPALTGTASVTISVTAVNQHDPVFGAPSPSNSVSFQESSPIGTSIVTVQATDNDFGPDGTITYSITGGDTGSYFGIDSILGKISTIKALSFDSQPVTDLEITATDGGGTPRSLTSTVTITVTYVNSNTPTCTSYSIFVNLAENAVVNDVVTTLTCSDSDTSDTLSYTITNGDPSSNFAISATGAITLASLVDYDSATQSYILEVTITDGTNTIQVSVVVNVTPVNEDTPSLTDVTIPIAENTNPSVITTFGATDLDYSPHNIVQYSITAVTQSGTSLFNIDSIDGEIQLIGNLDYESLPAGSKNYEITVEAVDGGSLTGTGTLTITVTDVNDNLPSCTQSIWTTSIDENLAAASNVQALGCSDPDGTSLTYNIVSGDDATLKFAISASTIQTTATPIDYETLGGQSYLYTLKVDVVDGGSPALTTTTIVIVQINPLNEDTPDFGAATSSQTILENVNVGHVVDTFTAADTDSGADGTITYQIMSIEDNSAVSSPTIFDIDSISGQLTTLTSLDRDAGVQFYTVVIRASDGNVIPKTADITVTVNIGDYNDNPPIFTQSSYTINTVTESTTASTSLYLFSASDADQSSTLSYSIEVGDTSKFEFDTGTPGQLNLKSIIDLDSPTNDLNYYTLRIIATDGGSPALTGSASVTISVTAINQHDPVFGAPSPSNSVSFQESSPIGTSIATVQATDNDFGPDGTITYSITGGDTGSYFGIDSILGKISTIKALSFDSQPVTNLEITATDGGGTPRSLTSTVTITVTYVNSNTPTCTSYSIFVNLAENAVVNDVVTTLTCSDSDTSDTLSYTITNGDPSSNFAISATGAITLASLVDYDSATQSYILEVTITDGTNTIQVSVVVNVTPVNEDTPSLTDVTIPIAENTNPSVITTFGATDLDYSPHNIVQYSITAVTQSGGSLFNIDSSDGEIQLIGNLDYESLPAGNKNYEITVEAVDGGSLTGTGTLTITVTDVNDNSPSCTQSTWTISINEDKATPYTVITPNLGCTDMEDGTTLTYSLIQTPGSLFSLSTVGVLTLLSTLDYETSTSHSLTITVSDSSSRSSTVIVNINVIDINEVGPTFTGTFSASISESASIGTSVSDVVANDPDTSFSFGVLEYSIINGDPSNQFLIDSVTGRVTTRSNLDRETTASYVLVIHAKEQGGPNTATVALTVTVTDVDDNAPTCTQTTFAETVNEDESVAHVILSLVCTDPDTMGTVTYSISSGDTSTFEMSGANLQLKQATDFEGATRKYDFVITVSDGTNSIDVIGSVNVGPINEAPPTFTGAPYTLTLSEATPVSTVIQTVVATDTDSGDTVGGQIMYSFTSTYPLFSIGATNGQIVLLGSLDRETTSTHLLNIQASDGTNTVPTTLTITVSDENDNSPVFSSSSYSGSITENDAIGTSIVTVAATDNDDGATVNGQITFSIIGGSTDFVIDATSGIITNSININYETATSYPLYVLAVDRNGDATSKSATAAITITVTNVNEFDPVYTLTTYTFNLAENSAVGTSVGQVAAPDADNGNDGLVYFQTTANAEFGLDTATGEIFLKTTVDLETTPNYNFEIVAFDNGVPQRSATATVSILLTNINDVTPICSPNLVTASHREDATGVMATLSCTDTDSGTLTYVINSVLGAGVFSIGGTGAISLTGPLDYETDKIHNIIVLVSDNGTPDLTATATVNIVVMDVNESPPVFASTPFAATVAETDAPGKSILTVAASDADTSETRTYSLSSTTYFIIDAQTGLISLKASMSPTLSPYTVNVCATDSNNVDALRTGCETITVTITDVNDNSPVFNPSSYADSVNENVNNAFSILSVTATDADIGAFGTIIFTITGGDLNSVFAIGPSTGEISINDKTFLDYETTKIYALTITATDGGGKATTAPVTISVGPINEGTPTFIPAASTVTIAENPSVGDPILTLTATDSDDGNDGDVTYSITSGANGKFGIDSWTGAVTVTGTVDREIIQTFSVIVHAVDGGTNPGALTGVYTITINIDDLNDNSPSCPSTLYTASLAEDTAAGTTVKQLVCSDGDLDPASLNNAIVYTEVAASDPGNLFQVDTTGLISVSTGATFDKETLDNYQYSVIVSDQGTPSRQITIGVYVEITDVNDNSPIFSMASYPLNIAENKAIGSVLTTVAATDADSALFGEVEYSITAGNGDGKFLIDATTGALILKGPLNREDVDNYILTIQAADKGTPPLVGTASIPITITDINDMPPVCSPLTYITSVQETDPAGTTVTTINCPDASDLAPNNVVVYSITAGDASNHFTIDINTGVIQTNAILNAQTIPIYSLTVTATDSVNTVTAFVQVSVGDINQQAPTFLPAGPYTINLQEGDPLGKTVIDLDATDVDPTAGPYIFSITGGNGDNKFKIDAATGVIIIQQSLDADTTFTYSLDLEVADGAGVGALTSTSALTINVAGINDIDPVCSPATEVHTVAEGTPAGTIVTTLTCSDADLPAQTLAYTMISGNGGEFSLDSGTGQVTLTATALDYETKTSHILEIQVSDQTAPDRLFTATFQVAVSPINEHSPVFPATPYTMTIAENTALGSTITTISATDQDLGLQQGTVRYSVVNGDMGGLFVLGINSGELKLAKSLDFETAQTHILTVRATDDVAGSGTEKFVDTTVTVTVTDINDNSPVFVPDTYTTNVAETAVIGATVLIVTATDDDSGVNKNVVYTITNGDPNNDFNFVSNNLLIAKALDYETVTSYKLDILVTDQGLPALTDAAVININIQAANEFPPVLTDTSPSATLSESTAAGQIIYTASATDGDAGTDGQIRYAISSGNTGSAFRINDITGDFMVWSQLDFDTPPTTYSIIVEARDANGLTDSLTLSITLTDENDHTPQFTQNTYTPSIDEDKNAGFTVDTVQATDTDSGVNGQVTYSIVSGDGVGSFNIDSTSGDITTSVTLDYELKQIYYLVVQAVDGGVPALTSSCLVRITVNDINDNTPVFVPADFTVNIDENVLVGTSVTTVNANDADSAANNNNVITYSVTNAFFLIDSTSGQISTKATLDRETADSHILIILATDQGTPSLVGSATVTVILDDINDNPPIITGTYDSNIPEDRVIGSTVLTVVATDQDIGVNGELLFSITNGNTNNDFKIDPIAGLVQIQNNLDRETTPTYTLEITVSDKGATPQTDLISAIITVDDVNDNNPVFVGTPYIFSILENSPLASPVGIVAATDQDVGANAALVFELVNFWLGNPTNFVIDAATRAISSSGPLDREMSATYIINCRVKDQGSPSKYTLENVTINILDQNDNSPVFDSTKYASTTVENSPVGTSILQMTVIDADLGANAAVTLTIDTSTALGTAADTFLDVDSNTGIISVKSSIDRENHPNFDFKILAVDGGASPLTSTATVSLIVADVNDNSPTLNPVFYNAEVSYAGQCSRIITTVKATDPDAGINAQLEFSLTDPNSFFQIDSNSGIVSLISTATLDAKNKYTISVGAKDNGSPSNTAASSAQVRIDTFIPNSVAVTFQLSINKADFEARKAQFITELRNILVSTYPACRVVVWCTEERAGTAISPPTSRRRLLATNPVNVHAYVVADDVTDDQANLNEGKTFLTYDQILAVTTSDATSGSPSTSISGSSAWNEFSVETVKPYVEETTPWEQTTTGIVIIVLCCLLVLALILLLIFFFLRRHRKQKRPITPMKEVIRKENVVERAAPVYVSKQNNVPDLNLNNEKKHPLPAVLALPLPEVDRKQKKRSYDEPFWGAPEDTKIPVRTPRVIKTPKAAGSSNPEKPNRTQESQDGNRNDGVRTPRNVIITPKELEDNGYLLINREFDGRAVDPVTNRVYEYNTRTNERRWVSTPDGMDVRVERL